MCVHPDCHSDRYILQRLYRVWTPACMCDIHSFNSVTAHLHMLHAQDSVYQQLHCACPLTLYPSPLSSQAVVKATLPPTLLLTLVWMVSSVTEDNEGRILWPTTPMWHIPKSPVVASDNRWRENRKQGSGWCIYTSSMLGSSVNSLMVKRYTACCCSDAWKTIRVFLLGGAVSLPSEHVQLPGIEITNPISFFANSDFQQPQLNWKCCLWTEHWEGIQKEDWDESKSIQKWLMKPKPLDGYWLTGHVYCVLFPSTYLYHRRCLFPTVCWEKSRMAHYKIYY